MEKRRVNKTNPELIKDLQDQIVLLLSHCEQYDSGKEIFAKEIASKILLLLYDKGESYKSILKQVNLKDNILFLSTNIPDVPGNLMPYHGLVGLQVSVEGALFYAFKHDFPSNNKPLLLSFKEYWEEVILRDAQGNCMTRGEIIVFTRNQDGGSHSDPALEKKFNDIKRGMSIGWKVYGSNTEEKYMANIHYAILRQIAFEILVTLNLQIIKETANEKRRKFSRNYKCYCMSGKKYKDCHGK